MPKTNGTSKTSQVWQNPEHLQDISHPLELICFIKASRGISFFRSPVKLVFISSSH